MQSSNYPPHDLRVVAMLSESILIPYCTLKCAVDIAREGEGTQCPPALQTLLSLNFFAKLATPASHSRSLLGSWPASNFAPEALADADLHFQPLPSDAREFGERHELFIIEAELVSRKKTTFLFFHSQRANEVRGFKQIPNDSLVDAILLRATHRHVTWYVLTRHQL